MMVSLQQTKAMLVIVCCACINMLGVTLPRLANKISAHDHLKASHLALKKQAEGLSAEYSRATATGTSSNGDIGQVSEDDEIAHLQKQVNNLLKTIHNMSEDIKKAEEAKHKAEVSLEGVKSQYNNLEKGYDELMNQNRGLQVEVAKLGGSVPDNKKSD